jgi:hypothetical protein
VPRERLERRYFRRWLHQNGRDVARLESAYTPGVTRLLGVPRYLWRQAAVDATVGAGAALALDDRRWSASMGRLVWFGGYLCETWGVASYRATRQPPSRRWRFGRPGKGSRAFDAKRPGSAEMNGPGSLDLNASGERNRAESAEIAAGR